MPVRVVIVAPWGERLGGAEEMLWLALKHCDRSALDPAVAFLGPGPFVDEVAGLGLPTAVIEAGRLRQAGASAAAVRRLAALLRGQRPELVVGWSAKAQLYCAPAAALAGIGDRVVWWQHMIPDRQWLDRLATALPARAVGCSSEACRAAQVRLRPPRPAFVVNPGIELNGRRTPPGRLRELLGIPPRRPVAGIVGRLQPWKGQDRFVEAIAALHHRGEDVHGLIVGGDAYGRSPDYAAGLDRRIAELGLGDRVTMTGQVEDTAPYFSLMDVAVNASEGEPFGMVLIEAMAAGVPVVAVADGGPNEIVEPGITGVLVEDGATESLAAAIGGLLADPRRRAVMAAAGRHRCRERFGAERMAARLTANLTEVARG